VLYVRQIAEQVRSLGADVALWLGESGLTEAQLADASLTIPYAVFEGLLVGALRVTGEPALGLLVGERLLASAHGMLGYAAMSSGTIRQAIDVVERYARLRISLLAVTHEEHPGEVRACYRPTQPIAAIERPLLEAVVLSTLRMLNAISMGACTVRHVSFTFAAPDYAALARDLFGCEVRYGQSWTGFAIPPEALDVPLRLADPEAFAEAARVCQRELDKLTANESLAARVRRLLLEQKSGFPSLQVTARLFGMAPRTLHRRLIDEGTSYRDLLEEVRHALAVEHLKSGRFAIEEIAWTLGYSDLANFRRAFKRWESMPPSEYRARHQRAAG
jgi:AraC-like DNA-binding protein